MRQAFLWRETRTPDKAGIFSLFCTEYQVGARLAKRAVDVRYDPENLALVEIWHDGRMAERLAPFVVGRHRRAHEEPPPPAAVLPNANWLGHLVAKRRKDNFSEPTPQMLAEAAERRRAEQDAAVFDVLAARLDPHVVDAPTIRGFLERHGPWDAERVTVLLDRLLTDHPRDLHVQVFLDLLHTQLKDSR